MSKLGWKIVNDKKCTKIYRTTNETDISVVYDNVNNKIHINVIGNGDLEHHLIEDCMLVINKLAELKGVEHRIS
jgi:imidazoleglycerol phosphate dehydratase HisB